MQWHAPAPGAAAGALVAAEAGELVRAERLIRQSIELNAWTRPAFEWARILERLGRPLDAVEVYEDLLDDVYNRLEGQARETTQAALDAARRNVARLEVSWDEIGQSVLVRVDGEEMEETTSTSFSVPINPGERLVRVESAGRPAIERRVRAEPGGSVAVAVVWSEARAMGSVQVRSDGAMITLNGEQAEDELMLELPIGEYEVQLSNSAGRRTETIEVQPGQTARYEFSAPARRSRAWIWIVVGAVVVGGATATAVILTRDNTPMVQLPIDDIGT